MNTNLNQNNQNCIPKIIHYCWFGNNEKTELVKRCIESWKKYLPDYEIREWNDNDLIDCENQYVRDAYKEKKWAFVSDYFRLYALYNFGGIYLDSDNEVFKSLNKFLTLDFFTGYEDHNCTVRAFTAVFGAKKGNKIVKDLLNEYNTLSFYNEDGSLNLYSNTLRVQDYFIRKYNLKQPFNSNKTIYLENKSIIYPGNYFCKYKKGVSYTMHHFSGSWSPVIREHQPINLLRNFYLKIYAVKPSCFFNEIKKIKEIPIFFYPRFKQYTVLITVGRNKNG